MAWLRKHSPKVIMSCARGSSANAAVFCKYLIERHTGIPVAAVAPSIATIYGRELRSAGGLFLAISQSGQSDDLVESAVMAKRAGALTAAIVNDDASPLAAASDIVLPVGAGPETSIAAIIISRPLNAGMAELVDAADSKSADRKVMRVRFSLPAPST